jgi:hypothetical protein
MRIYCTPNSPFRKDGKEEAKNDMLGPVWKGSGSTQNG